MANPLEMRAPQITVCDLTVHDFSVWLQVLIRPPAKLIRLDGDVFNNINFLN